MYKLISWLVISLFSEDQKPYVPETCCVKDRFWRYVNLDVCQKWRLGPPGSPDDGAINRALYYDVSSLSFHATLLGVGVFLTQLHIFWFRVVTMRVYGTWKKTQQS